jgi:hypothetical protein
VEGGIGASAHGTRQGTLRVWDGKRTLAQKPMTTNGTIAWIVIVIGLIPITGKVLFSAWRLVRRAAG